MIKVKDGYAKLIGTTYQGSATQVLLSNGGDLEYSASSKASTLVQRNASQHIYATYFNSAISDEALTDIGSVYVRNTSDTFIRRVSKTQFYSILDDKFVTLDTTQSITGAKTFSTSVRFANNASIIQNQNDTSNYTTILEWYKNGASRNTYNPSIGQHNIGGDGNGSICILPYPTETNPWGGTVGLFISKGVLKLDGKSVALAENYYTKTESDERYVGGNKAANHGSSGTAYTADTYSSTFVNKAFVAFAERGSWSYANNGYVSTDTGVNIPLAGTAIFQWGASDTNKTQLYITPHNNSGVSNPAANEMLFYTSNGSGYTSAWTRVLTHRNYTNYTVTKTGGGASGTWGISITGNAATAGKLKLVSCYNGTTNNDLWSTIKTSNSSYIGTATVYEVYNDGGPTTYGEVLDIVSIHSNHWQPQLWFDSGKTGSIRHRNKDYNNNTWGSWYVLLDNNNYSGTLDSRYVTLTTTQSITGAKTFSTSVRFANNASIIQNQNDTSNYTTILEWYKNGASRNTYNPSIGQHNIGGDGNGSICILPYPTETNPWGGTVGLFISKGVLKLDGKSVALAENYYTKTESDERYVNVTGDTMTGPLIVKAAITGTQLISTIATGTSPLKVTSTTVVTNLNSDLLDGYHANSFVKIVGTRFSQYQQGTYTKILEFTITSGSLQPSITFTWHPSECSRDVWADFSINIRSSTIIFYANWKGAARRNLWCVGNGTTYSVWVSGTKSSWDPYGVVQVMSTWEINTYKIGNLQYADTAPSGTYSATAITSGWASRVVGTLTMTAGKFSSKTYNGSADVTVNIPTNTSHLTNDNGFWTGTRYWANIAVSTASSTGTKPTFNTCYTSNWFRSTGNTGWYSESYGGGWYMTDSTWIRTYGSKSVYQNTGQIRTDGYLVTNGGITIGATSPNNGTYKSHVTGNSWSSGYIRAGAGFYHNSVNSNNYVLLAGGSYKSLADFAKGNAGASNRGVYVTNGTVIAMTYYLNATINSGASGKLAYYRGTNSIDDYTSTVGSSTTPMYLSGGVPTVCSGVVIKYWAIYTINSINSTVTFTKDAGNYSFLTSITRMRDNGNGAYCVYCSYPSGYSWSNTIIWGSGSHASERASYPEINGSLYVSTSSGGFNYFYVRTADDASTNNGKFRLFMIWF